ncbi:helix-turn-helix domain-containing protein [Paenibacillus sp. Soil766]|uniref:helix-turn-helix domain-containing protein n=1 Tax=Paenibacillus sp. Soil766 TaxID=1736404 RepID=UPI000B19C691|nr:helix-turn-helix domain-containing protein [Paenibacillus sp. Soil766]
MKDKQKAEEIAAQRVQLLSPLLAEGLDPAKAKELKAQICEQTGLSERTLRRYLERYRQEGFSGLKPMSKGRQPSEAVIAGPLMEQAILLRREVPGRSVAQLFKFWNGKVALHQVRLSEVRCKKNSRSAVTAAAICVCTKSQVLLQGVFNSVIAIGCGIQISSTVRTCPLVQEER